MKVTLMKCWDPMHLGVLVGNQHISEKGWSAQEDVEHFAPDPVLFRMGGHGRSLREGLNLSHRYDCLWLEAWGPDPYDEEPA